MRVERGLREGLPVAPAVAPAVVTVGNFDGVHRGHQAILARLRAAADEAGAEAAVMTFDPHPRCVLEPGRCPAVLTFPDEKGRLLAAAGVDHHVVLPFDVETSRWSAAHFLERLCATFGLRRLIAGPDFAIGRGREGDLAYLGRWGVQRGVTVEAVGPVTDAGLPVSSTRIREALVLGDVDEATRLLGWRPSRHTQARLLRSHAPL